MAVALYATPSGTSACSLTPGSAPVPRHGGIAISPEVSAQGRSTLGAAGSDTAPPKATFGAVFAIGEFRALWLAQVLSVAGDQLARVALTLLVFERTRSALLAAVTFAASVVPAFIGGITLSRPRHPPARRRGRVRR